MDDRQITRLMLSPREAAYALGVCERKLWSLSAPRGPIPVVRIGRAVRYRTEAIEQWAAEAETTEARR